MNFYQKEKASILAVVLKADHYIGTGHLMRVKALLPKLMLKGLIPYLITDSFDNRLASLAGEYAQIIKCSISDVADKVNDLHPKITLFDHYFLQEETEKKIISPVAVIDDLKRRHACDLLTDANFSRKNDDYLNLVSKKCKLLTGTRYSLIRPEFLNIIRVKRKKKTILINYGGADPAHACVKVVNSVLASGLHQIFNFIVLAGAANSDLEKLQALCTVSPSLKLITSTTKVGELFSKCDMAMGAYGGMFKERLCAGLPTVNTAIADNQQGCVMMSTRLGVGEDLLLKDLEDPIKVKNALLNLYKNRELYAQNGRKMISGKGIDLVTAAISELL